MLELQALLEHIGVLPLVLLILTVSALIYALRQLVFHPLADYPGPKLAALSPLPFVFSNIRGHSHDDLLNLHRKYGTHVRIGPSIVSIATYKAQERVHGGNPHFPKGQHYKNWQLGVAKPGLTPATDVHDHAVQRAALNPMFFPQNLKKQERHIQEGLDLLMEKLYQHKNDPDGVDINFWALAFSSDVITDLAFGETFGSLKAEKLHWVVEQMNKFFSMILVLDSFYRILPSWLWSYRESLVPKKVTAQRQRLAEFAQTRLVERMNNTALREDFITALRDVPEEKRLNDAQLRMNCIGFIIAGGETTSTALTAAFYFLVTIPRAYTALTTELRSAFTSPHEITATNVSALPYLQHCINETLRLFPPLATLGIRESPGADVDGVWVPHGVEVVTPQWVINRDEGNFRRAEEFWPERWGNLKEGDGAHGGEDRKRACQPFGMGQRMCIGKALAMMEMRLVIARTLFEFDIELARKVDLVRESRVLMVWNKAPVYLKLTPRYTGPQA
ncbi:cytochrome P450 [Ascodesmis nigricans]|uniref:Cytochrome P450 n=1 Tax=Ascodesmis nigricans TaxID=341454 RepID=A0A4S2MIF3_9PEZI|nr:cytochrome P450 [Ascodesmis nigricans]